MNCEDGHLTSTVVGAAVGSQVARSQIKELIAYIRELGHKK